MMIKRFMFLSILSVLVFVSCAERENNIDVKNIAKLSCTATSLKQQRFALADSIRFYEDSVLNFSKSDQFKKNRWQKILESMSERKLKLMKESRTLADALNDQIYAATRTMTLDEKRDFNKILEKSKEEIICE